MSNNSALAPISAPPDYAPPSIRIRYIVNCSIANCLTAEEQWNQALRNPRIPDYARPVATSVLNSIKAKTDMWKGRFKLIEEVGGWAILDTPQQCPIGVISAVAIIKHEGVERNSTEGILKLTLQHVP